MRRWLESLDRPVDASWLVALRMLFGLAMSVSMARFIAYGWVERFFVEPQYHFKYWGLGWVEPLSASGMHNLFWALLGCGLLIALGLLYRVAAILFSLGLAYVQIIDVSTYLNHYYLAALLALLLAASPAGRSFSLDRFLFARQTEKATVPAIWLYLFRFQVAVVYVFAGLAKLNSDWLLHAQPLRIWLSAKTDLPLLGWLFTLDGVPLVMSWVGFLFDTTIVGWLSWRKSRPYAYGVVLLFHALTRVLFPIGMFPVIMTMAALVFFEPSWPRTLARRLEGLVPKFGFSRHVASAARVEARSLVGPGLLEQGTSKQARSRTFLVGVLVYCTVQVALPMRGLLYGGNVLWHEQGMRFSWRVMLRAKGGSASFIVRDAVDGRVARVAPRRYLTDLQEVEMVSQPDLILQTAQLIAEDYEERGWNDVSVFVDSRVTLNGRRSAHLVDPEVDLTALQDGLGKQHWITPSPQEPPRHTRPVL